MEKSKYSDTQVLSVLKDAEAGQLVEEFCNARVLAFELPKGGDAYVSIHFVND